MMTSNKNIYWWEEAFKIWGFAHISYAPFLSDKETRTLYIIHTIYYINVTYEFGCWNLSVLLPFWLHYLAERLINIYSSSNNDKNSDNNNAITAIYRLHFVFTAATCSVSFKHIFKKIKIKVATNYFCLLIIAMHLWMSNKCTLIKYFTS